MNIYIYMNIYSHFGSSAAVIRVPTSETMADSKVAATWGRNWLLQYGEGSASVPEDLTLAGASSTDGESKTDFMQVNDDQADCDGSIAEVFGQLRPEVPAFVPAEFQTVCLQEHVSTLEVQKAKDAAKIVHLEAALARLEAQIQHLLCLGVAPLPGLSRPLPGLYQAWDA